MNFYCPEKGYKRKTHLGENSFFTLKERSVENPSSTSKFVELGVKISFNPLASVIQISTRETLYISLFGDFGFLEENVWFVSPQGSWLSQSQGGLTWGPT
jgi:hypothetical protein